MLSYLKIFLLLLYTRQHFFIFTRHSVFPNLNKINNKQTNTQETTLFYFLMCYWFNIEAQTPKKPHISSNTRKFF